jgi:hypothetical protein
LSAATKEDTHANYSTGRAQKTFPSFGHETKFIASFYECCAIEFSLIFDGPSKKAN